MASYLLMTGMWSPRDNAYGWRLECFFETKEEAIAAAKVLPVAVVFECTRVFAKGEYIDKIKKDSSK